MRGGPSKIIEAIVAAFVPPASREHVLGDLRERYTSRQSYLKDAFSAVPGAIAGRILRIADWQLLAIEACAWCVSFLAASWAAFGAPAAWRHGDFLRLAAPVAMVFLTLAAAEVYGGRRRVLPLAAACLGAVWAVTAGAARGSFPLWMLLSGGAVQGAFGVAMVSVVRMCFGKSGHPCGRCCDGSRHSFWLFGFGFR